MTDKIHLLQILIQSVSKDIFAEFEGNPKNPIITHRHLGKDYPIIYVGHGDLVEDCNGNWYVVMLASRPCEGYTNMGRETFLAKVEWEDGWPIINRGVGKLEDTVEISLPKMQMIPKSPIYSFAQDKLDMAFLTLRNPDSDMYELDQNKGVLKLALKNVTLKEQASPAYVALRQRHQDYQAGVQMRFTPGNEQECAGIAVMQSNEYHIRFEKYLEGEQESVRVISCVGGKDDVIASCKVPKGDMILKIVACGQKADFCYQVCGAIDIPTSGSIRMGGKKIQELNQTQAVDFRKNNLGFIFQSFNLIDELTVCENVELPLIYIGVKANERKERVKKVLEKVNLLHRANHYPQQLSGGQQQRVAIARAVVTDCKLLLADEPTGNLDSVNGIEVMELLSELNAQGTTIIIVTHSQRDAMYAHRVIQLLDGQIVAENVNRPLGKNVSAKNETV